MMESYMVYKCGCCDEEYTDEEAARQCEHDDMERSDAIDKRRKECAKRGHKWDSFEAGYDYMERWCSDCREHQAYPLFSSNYSDDAPIWDDIRAVCIKHGVPPEYESRFPWGGKYGECCDLMEELSEVETMTPAQQQVVWDELALVAKKHGVKSSDYVRLRDES